VEVNRADIVAEVRAAFDEYERALVGNDVAALDAFFWDDSNTVRYGVTESLYGYAAIASFRRRRAPLNLDRVLRRIAIATFGADYATVSAEFDRPGSPTVRQSQTWVRLPEGWRVVAAHVSLLRAGDG
jgi:hypothetical protein